jgi:hypothetical protein
MGNIDVEMGAKSNLRHFYIMRFSLEPLWHIELQSFQKVVIRQKKTLKKIQYGNKKLC